MYYFVEHNIICKAYSYATMTYRNEVFEMKIEVWSDFVCPFCYIGKRRLEAALEEFSHQEHVFIEYKSYELDPDAKVNSRMTMNELLAEKYGMSIEKVKEMNENVIRQAADVGLIYNFDNLQPTNTFDAHRLTQYATKQNKGNEMTERLLKAHFTESAHIGDHHTLIKLAVEIGLDQEEVGAILQTCKNTKNVRHDEEQAKEMGVQGVPFFVFNEKYAVSGAQPIEVFSEVLEKVWEEENEQPTIKSRQPTTTDTTYCCEGESCNKE